MKKIASGFVAFVALVVSMFGSSTFAVTNYTDPNNAYKNPQGASRAAGIDIAGSETGQGENFVQVAKNAINYLLGMLALIALVMLLWGGFNMVTAAGDTKKYEDGFTVLKHASFGLMMIGVAWFVVSIIFFVINLVTN